MKNKFIIQQAILVILVVVFAYPATNKLMEMGNFKEHLSQSPFISIGLAGLLSWLVPLLLLSIAGLLLFQSLRPFILKVYVGLMALFTLYNTAILTLAPFIPCSCIGFSDRFTWRQQLLFNVGVLALAATAVVLDKGRNVQTAVGNKKIKT